MIPSIRHKSKGQNKINYLASVSDLMSGLLFVFILTLAVAIIQARTATGKAELEAQNARQAAEHARMVEKDLRNVKDRLQVVENRLEGNARALRRLLQNLQANLDAHGIRVEVDEVRGVLRIPETAVTFNVGQSTLDGNNRNKLKLIGKALQEDLQCFQPETILDEVCKVRNPTRNTLDAVLIEGHTDNQTYRGDTTGHRNRLLSTARSNAVFDAMIVGNQHLENLKNDKGERLFSLSGYGASRPLPGHEYVVPTNDPANRRIEFRFIMTPPAFTNEESQMLRNPTQTVTE